VEMVYQVLSKIAVLLNTQLHTACKNNTTLHNNNTTEILLKVALYTITLTLSLHFILVVAVCCVVCVSPRIMTIFTFGINYCYG
jgi:hypothetical protein